MICDYCHRTYNVPGKLKGLCPECSGLAGRKPSKRAPKREGYADRLRRKGIYRP